MKLTYSIFLIKLLLAVINTKFTTKIMAPLLLEKEFKNGELLNKQLLEGFENFKFEEILNVVTFENNSGCSKFDEGKL